MYNRQTLVLRPGAEELKIGAVVVDYVIYRCPVRDAYALALEDQWGQYWTAPNWDSTGQIFQFSVGRVKEGFELNILQQDWNDPGLPMQMAIQAAKYMDILNVPTHDEDVTDPEFRYLIAPKHAVFRDAMNGTEEEFMVLHRDILDCPPELDEYIQARDAWIKLFSAHYPGHPGAAMDTHQISVRCARVKHQKRVYQRRSKRKQVMAIYAARSELV